MTPDEEALFRAARAGDVSGVRKACTDGADVNAKDEHGRTALIVAVQESHPLTVSALIACGADVNEANRIGITALMLAGKTGRVDLLAALLRAPRVEVDLVDRRAGWTALYGAALHGQAGAVALLLAAGADANARATDGRAALHWMALLGQVGMASLLLEHGAEVDVRKADDGAKCVTQHPIRWQD